MTAHTETITLELSDMTCAACERRIENGLAELPGIVSARASYVSGTVKIGYDGERVGIEAIKQTLADLHYPAIDGAKEQSRVKSLLSSALVLAAVVAGYALLEQTGIFSLFPMADQSTALPVLFVVGLLTSVHCIAMCGGINISQCAVNRCAGTAGRYQRILPSLLYNGGRVVSYTIIGGIVGAIGSAIAPSGGFKGIVAIAASAFMLIMGLNMLGSFPLLRRLAPRMPGFAARHTGKDRMSKGPFIVGLLNGLMPCGPLQSMQLYALSTGSLVTGALSMLLFSLGTVPLMFGLGALSSFLSARFTGVMLRVSAVLVMLLGLMTLNNGLSLSGFNPLF